MRARLRTATLAAAVCALLGAVGGTASATTDAEAQRTGPVGPVARPAVEAHGPAGSMFRTGGALAPPAGAPSSVSAASGLSEAADAAPSDESRRITDAPAVAMAGRTSQADGNAPLVSRGRDAGLLVMAAAFLLLGGVLRLIRRRPRVADPLAYHRAFPEQSDAGAPE